MLQLILPEEKYWNSFLSGVEELKKFPTPYDTIGMKAGLNFDNFADYKLDCENNRLGIGLKEGWVSYSRLWLIEDEKFVGVFDLRHSLTEYLKKEGGNVAYYIIPSARGRALAQEGLKLCCKYALEVLGLKEVLVTCNALNIASYKTMKKVMYAHGGSEASPIMLGEKEEKRVWIKTEVKWGRIRSLAVAVIKKGSKVLAIRCYDDIKKQTFYRLIGGGIEFWEKGEDTIKREFNEELGFEPINIKYFKTVENIFEFNGKRGHEIVLAYQAELPENMLDNEKFYMMEDFLNGRYAEFVEIEGNLIYPSGIL